MTDRASETLAIAIRDLAIAAGAVILRIYEDPIAVRAKEDRSPATDADEAAEKMILAALARLTPSIPVIAEEAVAAGHVPDISGGRFWLVDPLDGTREFISRNGEFTVNIALIEDGRPALGAVHIPAKATSYYAAGPGAVWRQRAGHGAEAISVRAPAADGLVVVASRSHRDAKTDEWLTSVRVKSFAAAGSSLKFCLVAAGEADVYPRLGRTMEWDTAAGQAVLEAAGGSVTTIEGVPLRYGKPGFENPFFIARGARAER
ncbi:MAG: 3'(2'),5'-bisphosphate nucleotidase CysQ [Alphaproteobacteria bacterium]|nr:3'(2'),5'-bisphosphate nucleotidase CysQ [Alphaproteobacteria bacterium]